MHILHRGLQAIVSEQFFYSVQVCSVIKQVGRKAVPQRMGRNAFGDSSQVFGDGDGAVELTRRHRIDRVLAGKEPHLRPRRLPPFAQEFEQVRRQHHIAIPLTTFAKTLNYHVTIVDARSAFATRERFPNADEIIVEWPDEVLTRLDLNPSTAVAVLTHDPKFDEPTLKVVLAHRVGYIGAIGSRKTSEERAERLKREGITDEQLQHIHGPIGLSIGATSPEEIALAIMAEIVATRHGK